MQLDVAASVYAFLANHSFDNLERSLTCRRVLAEPNVSVPNGGPRALESPVYKQQLRFD